MAAIMRNQHMATLLLSHPDTDINARRCIWDKEYTAFDIALYFEEDWEFAKLLLQYEAFDRGTAKGYITLALHDGHSDVVELLVPFALHVDVPGERPETVFHSCCYEIPGSILEQQFLCRDPLGHRHIKTRLDRPVV
jgi:hypothetical protein